MKALLLPLVIVLSVSLGQVAVPIEIVSARDDGKIVQDYPHVPISADLAVYPAPDSWQSTARPTVSILLLNASFSPQLDVSFIKIDGQRAVFAWNPLNRTLTVSLRDPIADGSHRVNVYLEDPRRNANIAQWSFFQDTVAPLVILDSLSLAADKRVYNISGTVVEPNTAGVQVNGFSAIVEGDRFLVPVLLWPGHNDLLVKAIDRAGNVGQGKGEILWLPSPLEDVEYAPFVHPNTSFVVRFPMTWEVNVDYELGPQYRADVAAFEPESAAFLRSSIAVVSRLAGQGMNEGLFLAIMENAVAQSSEQSRVTIVSRPRLLGGSSGPVTAQFSLIDALPEGQRIFRHVTGFWSRSVGRVWLMIGSAAVEKVETEWHALQTAAETFRVIEPEQPATGGEAPQAAIDRAFVVTAAAILFILTSFAAALYSLRKRGRRSPLLRR